MSRTLHALAACALLALAACRSGPPQERVDRFELLQADREFARASASRGLEAWPPSFASDAVIFPLGDAPVVGLGAIRDYWETHAFDPSRMRWEPLDARISAGGDLGYTWGTWTMEGPVPASGKYLTVWRRQGDGSWKVEADIGAPDPAGQ